MAAADDCSRPRPHGGPCRGDRIRRGVLRRSRRRGERRPAPVAGRRRAVHEHRRAWVRRRQRRAGALALRADASHLELSYEDSAPPFDPVAHVARSPVDPAAAVADRPIGQLGLALVVDMAERISYVRLDGRNRIVLALRRQAALNTPADPAGGRAGSSSRSPRSTCASTTARRCLRGASSSRPRAPRSGSSRATRTCCSAGARCGSGASRSGSIVRPKHLRLVRRQRRRQPAALEVLRDQRVVGGLDAVLHRQVERGRRLAAAADADQDHVGLGQVLRRLAVVVREREVDRLDAVGVLLALARRRRSGRCGGST